MGILNVTPDSFSDGGQFFTDPPRATAKIVDLFESGADVVDIGGESSRPGATPLTADEEWRRIEPILSRLPSLSLPGDISLDTYHEMNVLRAGDYPVKWINCVRGLLSPTVLAAVAARGQNYIAMHAYGTPEVMQDNPLDGPAAVNHVADFFHRSSEVLRQAGFRNEQIWLDPGLGFGTTDAANWQLLARSPAWAASCQIVVGLSRKGFIGRWLDQPDPKRRDDASKGLEAGLLLSGISMIRTHDPAPLAKLSRFF